MPSPVTGSTDGDWPGVKALHRSSDAVCSDVWRLTAEDGCCCDRPAALRDSDELRGRVACALAAGPATTTRGAGTTVVKLGAGATEPANTCRPFDVAVSLWAGVRLVAGLLCVAVLPVLPR